MRFDPNLAQQLERKITGTQQSRLRMSYQLRWNTFHVRPVAAFVFEAAAKGAVFEHLGITRHDASRDIHTVFGAERLAFRPLEGPVRNSRAFTAEVAATYRDPEAFEHLRGHHLDVIGRCVSPEILDFLGYPRG